MRPLPSAGARSATASTSQASRTVAQSDRAINISSRTKVKVWDGLPRPEKEKAFVDGPIDVDWTKKDLTWWFEYTTTAAGAVPGKARWEMSRASFQQWGTWTPVPGFGYTGETAGTRFSIDLNPYAPRPAGWAQTAKVGGPQQNALPTAKAGGSQAPSSPVSALRGDLAPRGASGGAAAVAKGGIPGAPKARGGVQALAAGVPDPLPASLSLYLRVVPLDQNGNDADLPSNAVELRFGPVEEVPFNVDPKVWPQVTFLPYSYRPVQSYTVDWQCWVKATGDVTGTDGKVVWHKGDVENACKQDDGNVVDDIVSVLESFAQLLKDFVNGVSKAFDSIKDFAASTIASAIPGCSTSGLCQAAIMTAINTGLVALGMPPDLPDFDQLQAMGEDYLAETIAQQVAAQTGLPVGDVAKKAIKDLIAKGKEAAQTGGGASGFWIPDDGHQYKPLVVTVSASNPAAENTPSMYLEIADAGARYSPAKVPIPSLGPGQSLTIAIALHPTKDPKAWMSLLPPADDYVNLPLALKKLEEAKAALRAWKNEYQSGTVTFRGRLTLPPFVGKLVFERSCPADHGPCVVQ